jgi:peptide/nickel transport system permease protein
MRQVALFALIPLVILHVVVLFAGFFAPYSPDRQNRDVAFASPTCLRFIDSDGQLHLRPFVYPLRSGASGLYEEDHSKTYPVRFLVSGERYQVAGLWSSELHLFGVDEPGAIFLMGTDDYGRDQFSRFLFGAQVSLLAGPVATCLALSIGTLLGAIAGFYGKVTDDIVMAMAELFLSLPWLYMLFGVRAVLPLDLEPRQAFLVIVSLLGGIGWARPARLIRGVVLSAKQREFVLAARGFGASDLYLLRRHVLPQAGSVLLTQAALLIPQYILAEVTMSFLGLGVNEPAASWGLMLASLQQYHALVAHWWMWLPAILLIPVFFAYHALAAALGGLDGAQTHLESHRIPMTVK